MLQFSPIKTFLIIALSVLGIVFTIPMFLSEAQLEGVRKYVWVPTVNLGLDLRGGSYLLLEMNSNELINEWLENIQEAANDKLRDVKVDGKIAERAARPRIINGAVELTMANPQHVDAAVTKLKEIAQPVRNSMFGDSGSVDLEVIKGENGIITLKPTKVAIDDRITSAISAAVEVLRKRVDPKGNTEPIIQRQGNNRILLQVPGLKDPKELKEVLGKTAKLTFHLVDERSNTLAAKDRAPYGTEWVESDDNEGPKHYLLKKTAILSGDELQNASSGTDQQTNRPVVNFTFNTSGAKKFGRITKENVGKPFAIVLDNGLTTVRGKDGNPELDANGQVKKIRDRKVISAPVINEPILGGSGEISGNFTSKQTDNLALLLKSGSLAASLEIVEERSVGPSLGADSIEAGKIAGIIGVALVIVFMIFTYGLFGVFANIALVINIALIFACFALFQSTLTMPGIAAIVLTIGMAVDANVLIYERIREEARAGKSTIAALEAGYSRAIGTIADSNLTTILAAIVLFLFGTGPVKGFAIALTIGIVTSVFSAVYVTRLLVTYWLRLQKSRTIEIPV